ncbi:MAG: hypothetical protein IIB64_00790 [Proteobacteria bacterium]|nr:hypothetical protein [Pseudomonadota bacterium]
MTLIVSANGRESIWLLADRRLSYKGRDPKNDGRKVMTLETPDGVAILGYAGLGATALGTEPADWMSAVLRGRNLHLEQSLGVLAKAMKKQIPPHLLKLQNQEARVHNVLIPAFLEDSVKLYTIDLILKGKGEPFDFHFIQHVSSSRLGKMPRIGIGGSGRLFLLKDQSWVRPLLRLISAYDRGKVSAGLVADHLASLNFKVHKGVFDQSVGSNCIVTWRNKKPDSHKEGSGHHFYTEEKRNPGSETIPQIANGIEINPLVGVMEPFVSKIFEAMSSGGPKKELNKDEINKALARLPSKPDENLR